jgi:hypothetical protein
MFAIDVRNRIWTWGLIFDNNKSDNYYLDPVLISNKQWKDINVGGEHVIAISFN